MAVNRMIKYKTALISVIFVKPEMQFKIYKEIEKIIFNNLNN